MNKGTCKNANDYAVFSKDFDKAMKNGMSEQAFTAFKADRDAKLGRFVSRQVADVIQSSQY